MTEWQTKKLGEVVEENKKSPFKVGDADNLGNYPFFTSGEAMLKHSRFLVDGENLFLSTGGSAYVKFYNGKSAYSTDTWCLKPKIVSSKFLYYTIFYSIKFIGARFFSGSGLKHLQKNEFLNFQIFFPPISVQQKIVLVLDTVRDAVEMQEKIIELTKELKNGLMAKLFREGKKKKLNIELGDENFFEIKLGGTPKTDIIEYWEGEIYWITPNDLSRLNSQYISNTERKITKEGLKNGSTLLLANSIILSTRAPIGYLAILEKNMAFNQGCKGIVIKDNKKVLSSYLYYFLTTQISRLNELGAGSTFRELSTTNIKRFKILLPDISEQREIVGILETIDQKIEIEQKKKALYEELFKTMLNKIMKQEIDVEKINL